MQGITVDKIIEIQVHTKFLVLSNSGKLEYFIQFTSKMNSVLTGLVIVLNIIIIQAYEIVERFP